MGVNTFCARIEIKSGLVSIAPFDESRWVGSINGALIGARMAVGIATFSHLFLVS